MAQARSKKFSHQNRTLEVKVEPASESWGVRVYENGKRVTNVTYSVSHETAVDALPTRVIDELMNLAKKDIKNGTVELLPLAA